MKNINTKNYWDSRFSSGDWENKNGRIQTIGFAKSQIKHLEIEKKINGTLLDFGCGLGDAVVVYRRNFPNAKLIGIDISSEAIKKCKKHYSQFANFICGSYTDVPQVDIIIASNVLEHLTEDKKIAKYLLEKCQVLYIIVPYKEKNHNDPNHEHVNQYDEFYFDGVAKKITYKIFKSRGRGKDGLNLYYNVYFKNILRFILGRNLRSKSRQIMFKIQK